MLAACVDNSHWTISGYLLKDNFKVRFLRVEKASQLFQKERSYVARNAHVVRCCDHSCVFGQEREVPI